MERIQNQKVLRMVQLSLLAALIVVLQLLSYTITIGTFPLSLVLIPLVIGAVLYGARAGMGLGLVFGVVVLSACFGGLDPGGNILWGINPFFTTLICLVKGVAAGGAAGAVAKWCGKRQEVLSVPLAAVTAPVVNTGLFCIFMFVFFLDTLKVWAGGTHVLSYTIFTMVGVNFLIELGLNIILAPVIVRVIRVVRQKR
ncbi:MAG: ECF transporter S component [Eubacteriales bacterium]